MLINFFVCFVIFKWSDFFSAGRHTISVHFGLSSTKAHLESTLIKKRKTICWLLPSPTVALIQLSTEYSPTSCINFCHALKVTKTRRLPTTQKLTTLLLIRLTITIITRSNKRKTVFYFKTLIVVSRFQSWNLI